MGENVLDKVVSNGLCIGCGMCVGLLPDVLRMRTDRYGTYIPEKVVNKGGRWGQRSMEVCPFADNADNEDTIASRLYSGQDRVRHRSESGYYIGCFAGHVCDEQVRLRSTSGGIIIWLAKEMLTRRYVDAVVCVGEGRDRDSLFEYRYVESCDELSKCRKSRYYPVEVSGVIRQIREKQGRVLFIGLPCFVKALRLACQVDEVLRGRVRYTIGLFCGHLKSKHYCEYLARCCGADKGTIKRVDFRRKVAGQPASNYAFEVVSEVNGEEQRRQIMMKDVWGGNWTYNLFMLDACEYCDDVMAETADVAVGDAWLGEYTKDYRGTSVIVCRNGEMLNILERGVDDNELRLEDIEPERVVQSQAGGLRQRRQGLQYRLYLAQKRGIWKPQKRVTPDKNVCPLLFQLAQRLRVKTKVLSREAFLKQQKTEGLDVFVRTLRFWIFAHRVVNWLRRIHGAIGRRLRRLTGFLGR